MANWFKATAIGALVGTFTGLGAFFLLARIHAQLMGLALFYFTPVAAGFAVALATPKSGRFHVAVFLSLLCSLVLLIALGKEGPLCAILAFPIMLAGLGVGIGVGVLARRLAAFAKSRSTATGILLALTPLFVFAGDKIDRTIYEGPRTESIESSVVVDEPAEQVWSHILTVDNVQSSKPFLMYVGLPIPQSCKMQGQGIGAKRTCYFNSGYIQETVIAWNPPIQMGLSIDRTHMPGRHWLGFESAQYRLQPEGQKTRLTRTTTITSHLYPVWYWRPLERLGVESEHNYILQDVVLKAKH